MMEATQSYHQTIKQNKIKVEDCKISTNVYIQWALDYDKPKTALYELRDSA